MQGKTDKDETGATISREYSYTLDEDNEVNNHMNDYVVHPAFRNGTDNNFKLGEWDEEVSGFWVAKYEAGYQANTITDTDGVLSTTISNSGDTVVYSDLNYTSYHDSWTTNALNQDLSSSEYSNQSLSYPVFKPLTYSYNIISIGDSYTLAGRIDTANSFYGLNSSSTDSHQMKNSEWGAVAYLTQSNYGRNKTELTINNYYTNTETQSPYKVAVTGLAGSSISLESSTDLNSMSAYNTEAGMKANTTGNITGVFDLKGGTYERISAYLSNGSSKLTDIGISNGSSGELMGATNVVNPDGYLTLSTRNYTIYPYDPLTGSNASNYLVYKGLLADNYGYGDAILETSSLGSGTNSWNSNYSYFARSDNAFFERGGSYRNKSGAGLYYFADTQFPIGCHYGFRVVLVAE